MFDYRALVILMTLMDHCELSLYELSVKVSLPIKEVKEGICSANGILKPVEVSSFDSFSILSVLYSV